MTQRFAEDEQLLPKIDAIGDHADVDDNSVVEYPSEDRRGVGHRVNENDGAGKALQCYSEGKRPCALDAKEPLHKFAAGAMLG